MATGHSTLPNALTEGFQSAFLGGAVIALLGFVATLVLIRTRDSRAHLEMANADAGGSQADHAGAAPASA
jgi:NhaP-type Na+/H+ or K+/H+ antiporter